MSSSELARRAGLSQPRVTQIEKAEPAGAVKVETLERIAAALDCRLVYAFVPHTSLEDAVRNRARNKATRQLAVVAHTMKLEDQEPSGATIGEQVERLAESLVDTSGLWSEP